MKMVVLPMRTCDLTMKFVVVVPWKAWIWKKKKVYYISRVGRYIPVQKGDIMIEIGDSSKTNVLFCCFGWNSSLFTNLKCFVNLGRVPSLQGTIGECGWSPYFIKDGASAMLKHSWVTNQKCVDRARCLYLLITQRHGLKWHKCAQWPVEPVWWFHQQMQGARPTRLGRREIDHTTTNLIQRLWKPHPSPILGTLDFHRGFNQPPSLRRPPILDGWDSVLLSWLLLAL